MAAKKSDAPAKAVEFCKQLGVKFWLDTAGDEAVWATISRPHHVENLRLRSEAFRRWLKAEFYAATKTSLSDQALDGARDIIEGATLGDPGARKRTALRVFHEDGIWIDTGQPHWELVHITYDRGSLIHDPRRPKGLWRLEPHTSVGKVAFRRSKATQALPPVRESMKGDLAPLRRLLGIESEKDWVFLVSFIVGSFGPGPYPVLLLKAGQGSAKTTLSRVVRRLIDPSELQDRALPKNIDDMNVAAQNQHLIAFDNVSKIEPAISDALARLATGAADATRGFHQQDEQKIYRARCPILINAITNPITKPDLYDRTLVVNLPPIPETNRRTSADGKGRLSERTFWERFDQVAPVAMAAIYDALAAAWVGHEKVELDRPPRMQDFAEWVTAAEPALGWKPGTFVKLYWEDREKASINLVQDNQVGAAVVRLVEKTPARSITGSPTQVYQRIREEAGNPPNTSVQWMRSELDRLVPELKRLGIVVEFSDGRWTLYQDLFA